MAGRCRCTPDQTERYRRRLSGPLLDRIDLMIEVPALAEVELRATGDGESSAQVQARVVAAHRRQLLRQGVVNARLETAAIDQHCRPDPAGARLLGQAMSKLDLSARAYHRVLRVARTVADLAAAEVIGALHVAEAIQYRRGMQAA